MKEKYKILLTCYNPYEEPFYDAISGEYDSLMEAQHMMYKCAIEEADSLNESWLSDDPIERVYGVYINEDDSVTVYVLHVGGEPTNLTDYTIMSYSECQVQMYNEKLRERYGPDITVEIKTSIDDIDSTVYYYYRTRNCGDSDLMMTAERAYENAQAYLDNIELYV